MSKTAISSGRAAKRVPAGRRPVGRPRGDGKPHLTRQAVFAASAQLIARHGYGGTSIRMIAAALEASPASLFHLFETKADLLNDMIAFAAGPSLAFYAMVRDLGAPPDVALYKSIYEEVRWVASADQAQASLFYLPELRQPDFAPAQQVRAGLVGHFSGLIEEGCALGLLTAAHPTLAAEQVFQLTETSILAPDIAADLSAEAQAAAAADLCLRGMLVETQRLDAIRAEAGAISFGHQDAPKP